MYIYYLKLLFKNVKKLIQIQNEFKTIVIGIVIILLLRLGGEG